MKETKQAWDAWTRRIVAKSENENEVILRCPNLRMHRKRRDEDVATDCVHLSKISSMLVSHRRREFCAVDFSCLRSLSYCTHFSTWDIITLERGKYARDQALTYENIVVTTMLIIYLLASIASLSKADSSWQLCRGNINSRAKFSFGFCVRFVIHKFFQYTFFKFAWYDGRIQWDNYFFFVYLEKQHLPTPTTPFE